MYVIHSWEWDRHRDDIQDLGKSLARGKMSTIRKGETRIINLISK